MVKIAVTAPRALKAFETIAARHGVEVIAAPMVILAPGEIDAKAALDAIRDADLVVFASGSAAYEVAKALREAGLLEEARALLAARRVATVEGEKGAVMIQNAFGLRPAIAASTVEEFSADCRKAAVFHYGARDEELLKRIGCSSVEFFPYKSLPPPAEEVAKALAADIIVFFSALAVRYMAEVGGQEALRRMKEKTIVAAGPGVSKALEALGLPHVKAPSGRIGDVALYVVELASRLRR